MKPNRVDTTMFFVAVTACIMMAFVVVWPLLERLSQTTDTADYIITTCRIDEDRWSTVINQKFEPSATCKEGRSRLNQKCVRHVLCNTTKKHVNAALRAWKLERI